VAFSRGKSHLCLSTPRYSKPDIGSTYSVVGNRKNRAPRSRAHEKFSFEANLGRSRVRMVIAMKMIRAKRSVVLVRRWLIRARQDLELVPAVYRLIRLAIVFYAGKALRGIRARRNAPSRQLSLLHLTLDTKSNQDRRNKKRLR
jgi:hypothetical protein